MIWDFKKMKIILDFKTNRKTMLAFKKTENYIGIQKDEFEMSGFSARILFH